MQNLLPFEKIKRTVLIRHDTPTSDKYGFSFDKMPIRDLINYGVVNIDKPVGPTSHQVSAYVQKILGIKKAGHSGTLDPKVTGVLPVATGRATRIVQLLLTAGKEYVCLMHLHNDVEEEKLKKTLISFEGKIKQLPPIKSAVKRQWRYRKVYYIDILEIKGKDVLFKIGCQAGTYIRKICHDIGQKLGVGAHMAELRRTKSGPFKEDTLCSLQDLTDAFWYYQNENNEKYLRKLIQPIYSAVEHLPKVWVMDTTVDSLCHGANLAVPGISKVESDIQANEQVAVMTLKDELICYGTSKMISREMTKEPKGIAVITQKVFMDPGVYPKISKAEDRL